MIDAKAKMLLKVEPSCDEVTVCPKCGSKLYQEVWEEESKVYLACDQTGCNYETKTEYEYIKYKFTYRDEFTTEVIARNIEEALERIDSATWRRTPYYLWPEYLEARYHPVYEVGPS